MIDYETFGRRAAATARRCVALVRHAERPPIDPDDPTFGDGLPVTAEGRDLAVACGHALAIAGPTPGEWAFLASRLRRTRLTAAAVAEGLGAPSAPVVDSAEASLPGLWIEDYAVTTRHYIEDGASVFNDRLLANGCAEGWVPVEESTRRAIEWISAPDFSPARCTLVCTHDVYLACLLQGLGCGRFSCSRWVGFLQGCALFERPGGGWDPEFLVPDTSRPEASFFQ